MLKRREKYEQGGGHDDDDNDDKEEAAHNKYEDCKCSKGKNYPQTISTPSFHGRHSHFYISLNCKCTNRIPTTTPQKSDESSQSTHTHSVDHLSEKIHYEK